ncbi:MAG: hypothetical protein VR69_01820 [Peptococcaceae bacterium BRH_c4b]|nr:MAG: hypothetical protein VR69_01820 [Peptococcaceae bacterium BRH_c4b]
MTRGEDFLQNTLLQAQLNRLKYGDESTDDSRPPADWALIAGEHMGHLLGAVRIGDWSRVEQEILHVSGPLLELHEALVKNRLVNNPGGAVSRSKIGHK